MYGARNSWASGPHAGKPFSPVTDYSGYSITGIPPLDGQHQHNVSFKQDLSLSEHVDPQTCDASTGTPSMYYAQIAETGSYPTDITDSSGGPPSMYPMSSALADTNIIADTEQTTMSPIPARHEANERRASFHDSFFGNDSLRSPESSSYAPHPIISHTINDKARRDSSQAKLGGLSPATTHSSSGRRRWSEQVEPGSARAIYLEKNRKAANKCRNKQKMQQDDLVETARAMERRNKLLKAEVEMLKGGVVELMEIVGQHTECADGRLGTYIQREADRLASGFTRADYNSHVVVRTGSTSSGGNASSTPPSFAR